MKELAVYLKTLNIYAHAAHNLASRIVFNQDHEMLAEIYEAADSAYDGVIERIIGLSDLSEEELKNINLAAAQNNYQLSQGKDNADKLKVCLELEKEICSKIEELVKSGSVTVGTEQMIGNIADLSEVRQYKLKQRLKK